jgi:uncharacterized protein (TIRG00374 family)
MSHSTETSQKQNRSVLAWFKRNRNNLFQTLRLVVALGLMALVLTLIAQDRDKLNDVNWTLIPLAWLLTLVSTGFKAIRWGLLVRLSHMNLSFRRLFGSYLVGAFFNTILPTSVGGDAVRAVDVANSTGRVADSTSSVLIERGMGLLAIVGGGSLFALFTHSGDIPFAFELVVHATFIAGVAGIMILRQGWFIEPIIRLMHTLHLDMFVPKVRSLQTALAGHLGNPLVLAQMLVLSVIANALTMSATYLVLIAVTDPIPLGAFVPMIALATSAELVPISIASLGVKESAYVFFLGLASVGSTEAGVIAINMRVLSWGHALLGGVVFLGRTVSTEETTAGAH